MNRLSSLTALALAMGGASEYTTLPDTIYERRTSDNYSRKGTPKSFKSSRKKKSNKIHHSRMLKRKHAKR